MEEMSHSNQFFRTICQLEELSFTVDVVLDSGIFNIARANVCRNVIVADLPTIFAMKAAALSTTHQIDATMINSPIRSGGYISKATVIDASTGQNK